MASALNDIALIALAKENFPAAEAGFQRMAAIYDSIYDQPHWLMGVARSNLGSVHLAAGRYTEAERLLREAVELYATTLSPENMNTAIARIKLGRSLARQNRWTEAETESLAGYQLLSAQSEPGVSWLQSARADLAAVYDALGQPEKAQKFRAEHAQYAK